MKYDLEIKSLSENIERRTMPKTEKPRNQLVMENPTVGRGFDPGIPDRKPIPKVIDRSIPDSRLALRNEARAKVYLGRIDTTPAILGNTDLIG